MSGSSSRYFLARVGRHCNRTVSWTSASALSQQRSSVMLTRSLVSTEQTIAAQGRSLSVGVSSSRSGLSSNTTIGTLPPTAHSIHPGISSFRFFSSASLSSRGNGSSRISTISTTNTTPSVLLATPPQQLQLPNKNGYVFTTTRSFASRKHGKKETKKQLKSGMKSVKRVPGQAARGATVAAADGSSSSRNAPGSSGSTGPALQHLEWVQFQKSIAVEGFETGQTVQAITRKNNRGGKHIRNNVSKEVDKRLAERKRLTETGGGLYPPLRYSPEETEQLLARAYAALPVPGGKRGTRHLRRQARRYKLVRKSHYQQKQYLAAHQIRKMEKRSAKVKAVKAVLSAAPSIQQSDRQYQAQVWLQWATRTGVMGTAAAPSESTVVVQGA